jgi:flagellar protein FliL
MAKVAPAPAALSAEASPPKRSKKIIFILITVLVLIAAGGAAAYSILSRSADAGTAEETVKESVDPPVFVIMDQFVVNLTEPDTTRYLQIGITYEVNGPTVSDEIKNLTPVIRSRILLVLSGKNVKNLTSIEGKQQLMDELVDLARLTITGDPKDPTRGVRDVHFSSFVIQ